MLGIQTRGGRMKGADKSTELWRHPNWLYFYFIQWNLSMKRVHLNVDENVEQRWCRWNCVFGSFFILLLFHSKTCFFQIESARQRKRWWWKITLRTWYSIYLIGRQAGSQISWCYLNNVFSSVVKTIFYATFQKM